MAVQPTIGRLDAVHPTRSELGVCFAPLRPTGGCMDRNRAFDLVRTDFHVILLCSGGVANQMVDLEMHHHQPGSLVWIRPVEGRTLRAVRVVGVDLETVECDPPALVTVVPEVAPAARARALADKIAEKSPVGINHVKQISNRLHDYSMGTYFQIEGDYLALGALSADFIETNVAAAQKRAPEYKGF